jgi:hypothetical protein
MRSKMVAAEGVDFWKCGCEQGFIDQFGRFMSREDAWIAAEKGDQIIRDVAPAGTLYSENLY